MPSVDTLLKGNIAGKDNYVSLLDEDGNEYRITATEGGLVLTYGGTDYAITAMSSADVVEITGNTSSYVEQTIMDIIDALVAGGLATDSTTT